MPGEADRARGTLASHSSPGGSEERSRLAREARYVTVTYREPGASWRPLWITLGVLAAAVLLDVILPGPDHVLAWLVVIPLVAGVFALNVMAGRRVWSLEVDEDDLRVGQDRLALSAIDAAHLKAMAEGADVGDVETGAQVLGGGWSVPKGRVGLPLRRTDGASLLVPTRDPDSLRQALLARLGSP